MPVQGEQNLIGELIQQLLGVTRSELQYRGRTEYPEEMAESNRGAHRLAAKLATEKYGFLPAQLMGLGIEGVETAGKAWRGDPGPLIGVAPGPEGPPKFEIGDIGANIRGSLDVARPQWETEQGLLADLLRALIGQDTSATPVRTAARRSPLTEALLPYVAPAAPPQ